MFSLKRFLLSECILKLTFLGRVARNKNQGYVWWPTGAIVKFKTKKIK